MNFSFASMIRLLALGAVGLTMLAVGVARLSPPQPTCRIESPVTTVSINDYLLGIQDRQPRWLDTARGTVALTPLEGNDVLEAASCSPWVDAQGRRQVVGRWSNRTYEGPRTVARDFGIAWFTFPDGRLVNQISLENFPISPPCWFPGKQARVLYIAGDGQLRSLDLESNAGNAAEGETTTEARPSLVSWDCVRPGLGDVYFGEVVWPRLSRDRFGDRAVASLRTKIRDSRGDLTLSRSEVWWLQLDPSGTRITAAGPLLDQSWASNPERSGDQRSPMVAELPDGTLGFAFAHQSRDDTPWSICLGRLEIAADGRPICRESMVRVLDSRSQLGPLAFSPDGHYLNFLGVGPQVAPSVIRYRTVPDAVAQFAPMAALR